MIDLRVIKLALRNLKRNQRRNLATGLAIAAGFVAFMLAAGYAYRVQKVLSSYTIYGLHVGHLGIFKHGSIDMFGIKPREYALDIESQNKVLAILHSNSDVEMTGRYLTGQGLVGNGCKTFPFLATGVDLSIESKVINHPELLKWTDHITKRRKGQFIWEFPEDFGAVAISEGLAKLLGKSKLHQDVLGHKPVIIADCTGSNLREMFASDANIQMAAGTWDGTLGAVDGEVVMHFSTGLTETNNSSITLSLNHLQRLLNTDGISHISVWLKDPTKLHSAMTSIRTSLGASQENFDVLPWTDERLSPYYTGTMQFIYVMVAFLGCVLAIVVVLSIFNSATMTVIERSQEVGMLRSIGFNQSTIRRIFIMEGFFLSLVSVLAGAVMGLLSMLFLNSLQLTIQPPGVAGGILLYFAPNFAITVLGASIVSLLGMGSTGLAVSGLVRKNIATLVSGASR